VHQGSDDAGVTSDLPQSCPLVVAEEHLLELARVVVDHVDLGTFRSHEPFYIDKKIER
jgi:hypothetical protein